MNNKILGKLIQKIGREIESGDCGLDDDEISEIANILSTRKLTLEQTARKLNISRTTLDRKINSGELPQPRKEPGGKKYFFEKDLENLDKSE